MATQNQPCRVDHRAIASCFNRLFSATYRTVLVGGAQEPFYQPPAATGLGQLSYREDFAASALHEAAHWCVAGAARRRLPDFGYTYTPPPRTDRDQAAFFAAELTVQTLERQFALACGLPFRPSSDDPDIPVHAYRQAIDGHTQEVVERYLHRATRARAFCNGLTELRN